TARRHDESLHSLAGGEVGLDGVDLGSEAAKVLRRLLDLRLVGGDQEVEAVLRAAVGELETDAGRSPRDNGQPTSLRPPARYSCPRTRSTKKRTRATSTTRARRHRTRREAVDTGNTVLQMGRSGAGDGHNGGRAAWRGAASRRDRQDGRPHRAAPRFHGISMG